MGSEVIDMLNSGGGVMHMEAINDAGYDPNAEGRQAPEVKIFRVFARLGSVVIVGLENDQQVEKQITIDEAMHRCRALLEMVKTPWKYRSDQKQVRELLQSFMNAVNDAKKQLSDAGFGKGVTVL